MLYFAVGTSSGFFTEPAGGEKFHHVVRADSKEEARQKVIAHYEKQRRDVDELEIFEEIM
jgi:hypothetical protein